MIWFFLGIFLGYGMGWNRKIISIPNDLTKCTTDRSQQEQDIAYYKKLTRTLVDENKKLRDKINAS